MDISIYADGASRNNQRALKRQAYYSFKILDNDEKLLYHRKEDLKGFMTNNQAEYMALIRSLACVEEFADKKTKITVYSDSQLVIRQLEGVYKVKDEKLKKLNKELKELEEIIPNNIEFVWVKRNIIEEKLGH